MNNLKECIKCGSFFPIEIKFWHKKGNGFSSQCKNLIKGARLYDK